MEYSPLIIFSFLVLKYFTTLLKPINKTLKSKLRGTWEVRCSWEREVECGVAQKFTGDLKNDGD